MPTKIYRSKDTIFYNSQCLFVEFDDIIKMPSFMYLYSITKSSTLDSIFDLTEIKNLNADELLEWYVNRKHRNFFMDIPSKNNIEITDKNRNELLIKGLSSMPELYSTYSELYFADALNTLSNETNLIKKIVVYSDYNTPYLESYIHDNYNENIIVKMGNFIDTIKNIPNDSTFVFSDIKKVLMLEEAKKLDYSSILISNGYRYNYKNLEDFIIPFDDIVNRHVLKYNFFDNFNLK